MICASGNFYAQTKIIKKNLKDIFTGISTEFLSVHMAGNTTTQNAAVKDLYFLVNGTPPLLLRRQHIS